jgi:hypothetical protein
MTATIINFPRRKAREASRREELIAELRTILARILARNPGHRHDESKFLARIAHIEAVARNLRAGGAA